MQCMGDFCGRLHVGGDCLQGWVDVGVIVRSGWSRVTCIDGCLASMEGICTSGPGAINKVHDLVEEREQLVLELLMLLVILWVIGCVMLHAA